MAIATIFSNVHVMLQEINILQLCDYNVVSYCIAIGKNHYYGQNSIAINTIYIHIT